MAASPAMGKESYSLPLDFPRFMGYSVRTDLWRYTEWRNRKTKEVTARELYDHFAMEIDRVNVASRPETAALVKQLHRMMDAGWRAARPG